MTAAKPQTVSLHAQTESGRAIKLVGAGEPLSSQDAVLLRALLNTDKYDYIDHPLFAQRDAKRKIFKEQIPRPDTRWYQPLVERAQGARGGMGKVGSVLLTAAQERALFLQFNFSRQRASKLRDQLLARGGKALPIKLVRELLDWHRRASGYRDQIAETNLALVLAMAKRTRISELEFGELVSEGNMALLRAVDKFDASRGFKFSTYGCRAILKSFSRIGVKQTRLRNLFPAEYDPATERSDFDQEQRNEHEENCADEVRRIIEDNRAELTDIEQEVIEHRFAVSGRRVDLHVVASPLTLEQVGRIVGVTKERVRQIQNKALMKIKDSLESDYLR